VVVVLLLLLLSFFVFVSTLHIPYYLDASEFFEIYLENVICVSSTDITMWHMQLDRVTTRDVSYI
jgi:hypothetical protein